MKPEPRNQSIAIVFCVAAFLFAGCASTRKTPAPPFSSDAAVISACLLLDGELSSLSTQFCSASSNVVAELQVLAPQAPNKAKHAELLRHAQAATRYHKLYVELSKRKTELLLNQMKP